jgi:hypothetical protein
MLLKARSSIAMADPFPASECSKRNVKQALIINGIFSFV